VCHVLIIEDEALVALDLQDMVASAGATTFSFAETERGAIAAARRRRPDVIMSDVMLREGTGPQAVATIQDEWGPLPVIYVTATPEACTGCDPPARVLTKPVATTAVRAAFRAVAPR
jgi:CheY-like chemotaxis protein